MSLPDLKEIPYEVDYDTRKVYGNAVVVQLKSGRCPFAHTFHNTNFRPYLVFYDRSSIYKLKCSTCKKERSFALPQTLPPPDQTSLKFVYDKSECSWVAGQKSSRRKIRKKCSKCKKPLASTTNSYKKCSKCKKSSKSSKCKPKRSVATDYVYNRNEGKWVARQ